MHRRGRTAAEQKQTFHAVKHVMRKLRPSDNQAPHGAQQSRPPPPLSQKKSNSMQQRTAVAPTKDRHLDSVIDPAAQHFTCEWWLPAGSFSVHPLSSYLGANMISNVQILSSRTCAVFLLVRFFVVMTYRVFCGVFSMCGQMFLGSLQLTARGAPETLGDPTTQGTDGSFWSACLCCVPTVSCWTT